MAAIGAVLLLTPLVGPSGGLIAFLFLASGVALMFTVCVLAARRQITKRGDL
jgi:hypothetical protein